MSECTELNDFSSYFLQSIETVFFSLRLKIQLNREQWKESYNLKEEDNSSLLGFLSIKEKLLGEIDKELFVYLRDSLDILPKISDIALRVNKA